MTGEKCQACKIIALFAGLGALNWGLVGVFDVNLVTQILGDMTGAARLVYGLIGVAGLLTMLSLVRCCPCAGKSCETSKK